MKTIISKKNVVSQKLIKCDALLLAIETRLITVNTTDNKMVWSFVCLHM